MKFKESRKRRPLPIEVNEEEFTELLEATRSMHHKVAFLLAWESGLRISEVTHLQKIDFNIEEKRIRINDGKGGKDRIVPLPVCWKEHLIDYIPIKCSNRALQKSFEVYTGRTGLRDKKPGVHFHSLRHGFATHFFKQGATLPQVQMALGHNDISTTMVYVNLAPEEMLKKYSEVF